MVLADKDLQVLLLTDGQVLKSGDQLMFTGSFLVLLSRHQKCHLLGKYRKDHRQQ